MITTAEKVAGIEILSAPCPKCGHKMFKRPCPCRLNRQGWAACAKCIRCGHTIGIEKRRKRA